MAKVKLVAADIDRTILPDSRGILPLSRKGLQALHEDGVLLGIASGRPLWQGVKDHAKEWKLGFDFDFLIGLNGSELSDGHTGEKRVFHLLSKESLKKIVLGMDRFHLNPFVYREGYEFSEFMDEEIAASGRRHGSEVRICRDISDLWSEETAKILYRTDDPKLCDEIEAYAREHINDENITCFKTSPTLLELQSPKINKGVALQKYCEANHIDMKDTAAFGDAENDIEMLKMAGRGICLKSGLDDVKAEADEITDYGVEEDGFGHYIFDHLL